MPRESPQAAIPESKGAQTWARLISREHRDCEQAAETPAESPREISPRMFDNPLLEWASRVHPIVPPLLYLPVISFLPVASR